MCNVGNGARLSVVRMLRGLRSVQLSGRVTEVYLHPYILRPPADLFIGFGGNVVREKVSRAADPGLLREQFGPGTQPRILMTDTAKWSYSFRQRCLPMKSPCEYE